MWIFFETCTVDARYGILHCEVRGYTKVTQSSALSLHRGTLAFAHCSSHSPSPIPPQPCMEMPLSCPSMSWSCQVALSKQLQWRTWQKGWFRGQGVRADLRSAMQLLKSVSHANYSCPGTSVQTAWDANVNDCICESLPGVPNFLTKTSLSRHSFKSKSLHSRHR